jgi:hypothetical protein
MPDDPPQDPTPEVQWSPATIQPSRKAALLRVLFGDAPDADASEQAS